MHTGKSDLLETCSGHAIDLAHHISDRYAARRASGRRDDAVRARLRAAGLHAKGKRRAARDAWFDGSAAAALTVAEALRGRQLTLRPFESLRVVPSDVEGRHAQDEREDRFLLIVRHDPHHVRQIADLVRTS